MGALGGTLLLQVLGPPAPAPPAPSPPPPAATAQRRDTYGIRVQVFPSRYKASTDRPSGWFTSGQRAAIALSSDGFDRSGGPLSFLHPGNIATDGRNLILADTRNNRVLVWHRAPEGNVPPDLVLGQRDFEGNAAGTGLANMNWPGGVATDGKRLVVADTWNNRLLVWRRLPRVNGTPADFEIVARQGAAPAVRLPYSVWTDGRILALANRGGENLLIWRGFPDRDRPPDVTLNGGGDLGTPRYVASDGHRMVVASYDAFRKTLRLNPINATFFWSEIPRTPADGFNFCMKTPEWLLLYGQRDRGALMRGAFGPQGQFVALSEDGLLYGWRSLPRSPEQAPDLFAGIGGLRFEGGDTSGLVFVGGTLYVSLMNGHKVVGYRALPSPRKPDPDFALGAAAPEDSPMDRRFILVNPNPATDGRHLFVTSDFNRQMYVYRSVPDQTGARPDAVYRFPEGPWDTALQGNRLVAVGEDRIWVWRSLPLHGELPDREYRGQVGTVRFQDAKGVALDSQGRLFLADEAAGKVWVFAHAEPGPDESPIAILDVPRPRRLSVSDRFLSVAMQTGFAIDDTRRVLLYPLASLSTGATPLQIGEVPGRHLNWNPQDALLAGDALFVANTFGHNVLGWKDVRQAVAGRPPDLVLGRRVAGAEAMVGRNTLAFPGALAFDGAHLWVGEFKFSQRLLRFDAGDRR